MLTFFFFFFYSKIEALGKVSVADFYTKSVEAIVAAKNDGSKPLFRELRQKYLEMTQKLDTEVEISPLKRRVPGTSASTFSAKNQEQIFCKISF